MSEEYNIESMCDDAEYILGLVRKYSGKRLALIDVDTLDPETIDAYERNNLIIPIPVNRRKIKYNLTKQGIFADRIERLYALLEIFISEKCSIGPRNKITASALILAFNTEIGDIVNNKVEFPVLMKRYIETNEELGIMKQNTSKGIVYTGISLRSVIQSPPTLSLQLKVVEK
jgi:hypothetical protein